MNLIKCNDKRVALNLAEIKQVEQELHKETEILSNGTDTKFVNGKARYFYWFRVKKFVNLPLFIGRVHEHYGRNIEIEINYQDKESIEIYFRGLQKELR